MIHKKTKQRLVFNIKDYTPQLNEASEKAAEVHYQEGILIAASGNDVDTQKMAAKEFKKAADYVPGYKDSSIRYEESRRAGVKKMAILPFEDKTGKAHLYGALSERITDDIIIVSQATLQRPSSCSLFRVINLRLLCRNKDWV